MRHYHLAGMLRLLFIILVTHPSLSIAQSSTMNVNATVLSPINVESLTHLDLGFVLAGGGNQGARASDPNAGTLSISKSNMNGLTLSIQYPTALAGPAGATLPIIFNGNEYGSYTPNGGSTVTFNPSSPGSSLTDILQNNSAAVFRFGAMVNPPLGQTVGSYTAQIVLTLSYAAFA